MLHKIAIADTILQQQHYIDFPILITCHVWCELLEVTADDLLVP